MLVTEKIRQYIDVIGASTHGNGCSGIILAEYRIPPRKRYGAILAPCFITLWREELCKLLVNEYKHSVAMSPISRFPAREERNVILKQAFGNRSKQSLSDLCFWVEAELPIRVTIRAGQGLDCCGERLVSLRPYQGYSLTRGRSCGRF